MIGAQDVSTPPYSTPTSPTAALHDQNMNFQHTQNKAVPYHQGRFTKFPGGGGIIEKLRILLNIFLIIRSGLKTY